MKPLLVGETNPYGPDPQFALYPLPEHSAGGRLCSVILGMSRTEYLRTFDRVNLCTGAWSLPAARAAATKILNQTPRPLILLGAKVCRAFGPDFTPFSYVPVDPEFPALALPHPSGRNRIWNEPDAVDKARCEVYALLRRNVS